MVGEGFCEFRFYVEGYLVDFGFVCMLVVGICWFVLISIGRNFFWCCVVVVYELWNGRGGYDFG